MGIMFSPCLGEPRCSRWMLAIGHLMAIGQHTPCGQDCSCATMDSPPGGRVHSHAVCRWTSPLYR